MRQVQRFKGAFLEMVTEEVELPNGRVASLDIVRHPGAAAVVPFLDEDRVVLIRQYRYAAGGTILEVPAGKLDPGEDPETCALRELQEEAGQRARRIVSHGSILTTPGFTDERIHLFSAFDLEIVPSRLEDDEIIDVVEMGLDEALERVWSGELCDAKSALALVHAARSLGRLGPAG
jgi:ADP-ribose pyrophosphatase